VNDRKVALAAKFEELHVKAFSHGVEWLRRALSEMSRDELRDLAANVRSRPQSISSSTSKLST
jgi:hypothetical protein